jgi:hypothetical protein
MEGSHGKQVQSFCLDPNTRKNPDSGQFAKKRMASSRPLCPVQWTYGNRTSSNIVVPIRQNSLEPNSILGTF